MARELALGPCANVQLLLAMSEWNQPWAVGRPGSKHRVRVGTAQMGGVRGLVPGGHEAYDSEDPGSVGPRTELCALPTWLLCWV